MLFGHQMHMIGAHFLRCPADLTSGRSGDQTHDQVDVELSSCPRQLADRRIVEHASAQRLIISAIASSCPKGWIEITHILSNRRHCYVRINRIPHRWVSSIYNEFDLCKMHCNSYLISMV